MVVAAARTVEPELYINAATLSVLANADGDGGFHAPSINDFFPPGIFFHGSWLELTRIGIVQIIAAVAVVIIFLVGTRRMAIVPGRFQSLIEMGLDFIRVNIAEDILGKKDGKRFLPILTSLFFTILLMNITSIIPFLNIAGTSVIGAPLVFALVAYVTFIYAGIRKSPKNFFRNALMPPGVPWFLYILIVPLEFLSTFIIRPVTLTLRLLMNMMVGHMMLVLFFSATSFFLITLGGWWSALAAGSLAFGFAFTMFEMLVAFLQAYVFTILTTVYIQLAVAEEH